MTRFQRWGLYVSTAVAPVSGVVYFVMKRFMTPADPWAVINHPLEPWMLKLHILSAPLMLFAVGLITTQHIWRSLKSSLPTGRKTGVTTALLFGPMVLTGYLIQVVTTPLWLDVLGWTHLALGLVCAVGIFAHRTVVGGRKRRRKRKHGLGDLPVIQVPEAEPEVLEPVSREAASADATPSASGRRGRHSGSYRPQRDLREESSSGASS